MVNSKNTIVTVSTSCEPLCTPLVLPHDEEHTVAATVDYKHNPAVRSKTGRWRSAGFIIGVEMAERIAYYGILCNLITFLTEELRQSTATAAANVNAWAGVASLLPICGAVIADSYLGKHCTIISASLVYILGLALLTLSAMLPSLNCPTHGRSIKSIPGCLSHLQTMVFFGALYLVALGQGGHKPCVQAFGADQFDGSDPEESKAKSSFFNWWYFGLSSGALLGIGVLSYVQDNFSWGLAFGIPCIVMVIALLVFILGTFTYRFIKVNEKQTPFSRIGRVFIRAARNRHAKSFVPEDEEESQFIESLRGSEQFRFLDKALLSPDTSKLPGTITSKSEVEEAKALLRLFPIWATNLVFGIVSAQISTFFTKQGVTLDRSVGPSFKIPAAGLQSFMGIFIITFIPIYDCLLVPFARRFTGKPSGISVLQRIGIGLFISIISMVVAAIVEKRRLNIALHYELIDLPNAMIPMSIWWLLPQYALFGIADAFTIVGQQEFFYDQVPVELRSVGVALYLSGLGVGNFLSSILLLLVDKLTTNEIESSWLTDNLNRAHLDYFYWLLALLSTIGFVLFLYFSRSYIYTNSKIHK
ncbi:protein NRT1/ PTR FAMILY 5.10-like isoform X1 [Silene latifolia]|uniref:protein NRT1/ PTR FAMILY 5.10-like isoform X1 n=1 Tax=Silene latifolia TaxID=37657 RepID=UPI003D77B634